MSTTSNPRTTGLRTWATTSSERAAVELLVAFRDGHLLEGPWIRRLPDGGYWFDADTAAAEGGYLSGGERRLLSVAMSLVSPEHPVDLGDVATGVDHDALVEVILAITTAGRMKTPLGTKRLSGLDDSADGNGDDTNNHKEGQ